MRTKSYKNMKILSIIITVLFLFSTYGFSAQNVFSLRLPSGIEKSRVEKGAGVLDGLRNFTLSHQSVGIYGSGIGKEVGGEAQVLFQGPFDEVMSWLVSKGYNNKEAENFKKSYEEVHNNIKALYPVLEEGIEGRLDFVIAEGIKTTAEIDISRRILTIDIETLQSEYLLKMELKEELVHLARVLLDERSEKGDAGYYKFWAFEEFAADYQKIKDFSADFNTVHSDALARQDVIDSQAEAIALLLRWNSPFIKVIVKAISEEHRDLLAKQIEKAGETQGLDVFRSFDTYTNDADMVSVLKDYAQKRYPSNLYDYIEPMGRGIKLVEEIYGVLAEHNKLKGRFGRGPYHGINKQRELRHKALSGGPFFDFLMTVVEDNSAEATRMLLDSAKGEYIPEGIEPIVVVQKTTGDLTVRGNWSAVINLIIQEYPRYSQYENKGFGVVTLSAGTGSRNAGLTQSGWGDKGKQFGINGEPFMYQILRQIYQFFDPAAQGILITTNDGIESIAEPIVLGEFGIEMIGAALMLDSSDLDGLGTAEVNKADIASQGSYAKPIVRMHEKKTYAQRREIFGHNDNSLIPTNWAYYFLTWQAVKKIRDTYSALLDKDGKYLHLKYGLDMSGDLFEAVTSKTRREYVMEKVEKGWDKGDAGRIWDASYTLMTDKDLGGAFGFVDAGEKAVFVDTGDNKVFFQTARGVTERRESAVTPEEIKRASKAKIVRDLLELPEPDEKGRIFQFKKAYLAGREVTMDELRADTDLLAKIGPNVLIAGEYIAIGKITYIGAGSVIISPLINELSAREDSDIYFVEEAGRLDAAADNLICDVYTGDRGKVRIYMPVGTSAKDKLGKWILIDPITMDVKGDVFITKEKIVGVTRGISLALLNARLLRDSGDQGKGQLVDSEGNVIEKKVLLDSEVTMWDMQVWPRSANIEGRPISFQESSPVGGKMSFADIKQNLDNDAITNRYSEEKWRDFVSGIGGKDLLLSDNHEEDVLFNIDAPRAAVLMESI